LVVDHDGTVTIDVKELGHIELPLGATSGYVLVNGERAALPIGSTLQNGVFYWQLGPGFLGDYPFVFERPDGTDVRVRMSVRPGTRIVNQSPQ
jgi:archaellum component FlaG (FlaF/FlaG flagellin family)